MKIYFLAIIRREPLPADILVSEFDNSSFSIFNRNKQELSRFFALQIAERTQPGVRQTIQNDIYYGHVYSHSSGLSCVALCDQEYPQRVAHSLVAKTLTDFISKFPRNQWDGSGRASISWPQLKELFGKYQDPKQADALTKLQSQLDDTTKILQQTVESILQRGEKLEDLMERSGELSNQTKTFYKASRKTNSCCTLQ